MHIDTNSLVMKSFIPDHMKYTVYCQLYTYMYIHMYVYKKMYVM